VEKTAKPYNESIGLGQLISQCLELANAYHPDGIYKGNGEDVKTALGIILFGDLFPTLHNGRLSEKFKSVMYPRSFKANATKEERSQESHQFLHHFHMCRKFFICGQHDHFGVGPAETQVGDIVCLLLRGRVPYILRPLENGNYHLIGECYLHDMMDGLILFALQTGWDPAKSREDWVRESYHFGRSDLLKWIEANDAIEHEWEVILE
jgi:hypothetical protein